jgi:peroxiredoxin
MVAVARGSGTLPAAAMNYRRLHPFVLSFSAVLLAVPALRADDDFKAAPAPAWKLPAVDGQVISSDQFKGKVVVLDFWAAWCPPCRAEIPGYVDVQKKHGREGLAIVGVSLDRGGPDVVRRFIDNEQVNYQVVLGDDRIVGAFGGVEAIPTTVIIDRNGVVRYRKVGAMETAQFEAVLEPLLKSPETARADCAAQAGPAGAGGSP